MMAGLETDCEWEVEGLALLSPEPKSAEFNTPRYVNSMKHYDFNESFAMLVEEKMAAQITLERMEDVINNIYLMDDKFITQLNNLIQLSTDNLLKEQTSKKKKHTLEPLEIAGREAFLRNIRDFTGFSESVPMKLQQLVDVLSWKFLKKMISILGLTVGKYIKKSMLSEIIIKLKYPLKINDTKLLHVEQKDRKVETIVSPLTPHSLYDNDSVLGTKADTNMHLSFDHNCFASPAVSTGPGFDDTDLDFLYSMIG